MIDRIKIYGERNSGTRFLNSLLQKNTKNVNICDVGYKSDLGWKHGIPRISNFKKDFLDKTLFIIIIRDLEPWIKSMYKVPYHYVKPTNIKDFLINKLHVKDRRLDHDVNKYPEERNKTIFELRYYKINSYLQKIKDMSNVLFINLEDTQKDMGKNLLNILQKSFNITDILSQTRRGYFVDKLSQS